MSKTFGNFEFGEHLFNICFSSGLTCVICLAIGVSLNHMDFFSNEANLWVILALCLVPVWTFITVFFESELKIAYYKTWHDKIMGLIDQSKILQRFAKQYKIKNWKNKLEEVEADGRWHFHADTNYMHRLAEQRDLMIGKIYREYLAEMALKKTTVISAQKELSNAIIKLEEAEDAEKIAKKLCEEAKSPGEIYKQRQSYQIKRRELAEAMTNKSDAEYALQEQTKEREEIINMYQQEAALIVKIFYSRYLKYTESAIKKINKINGLKYTIVDMSKANIPTLTI